MDVGASVQLATQVIAPERPVQVGGALEVKRELLRASAGEAAHVLSLGAVVGGAVSGRLGLSPWWSAEVSMPLLYGVQVGVYRRHPASWALQLSYLTDPSRFTNGALQLQLGWFFDLAP